MRRWLLCAAFLGTLYLPAQAYKSVEWYDTGEFEFETADELYTALKYYTGRALVTLDDVQFTVTNALQDGQPVKVLSLTYTEPQVWRAIESWLSNVWYKVGVQVLKLRADYTDSDGNKHYRVYLKFLQLPPAKR